MTAPLDPSPAPPKTRKRTIAFLIFLALVAMAGIAGIVYWRHASQFEETDDAYVDGNIVTVSPQVAGRVSVVRIKDNQDVKAGDVLVEIEATDFGNAVTQARAWADSRAGRMPSVRARSRMPRALRRARSRAHDCCPERGVRR